MLAIDTIVITQANETCIIIGISPRGNYVVVPQHSDGTHFLAHAAFELSPLQVFRVQEDSAAS